MADIEKMAPKTGRMLTENNEVINKADILKAVYDAVKDTLKVSVEDMPATAATAAKQDEMINALKQYVEADIDTGVATGGNTGELIDTSKAWIVNGWTPGTLVEIKIGDTYHYGQVASNIANKLTFSNVLGAAVTAGCTYKIKVAVIQTNDVRSINGTTQTARNWSDDFAKLDTPLSDVQEGITGAGEAAKTLADLNTTLTAIQNNTKRETWTVTGTSVAGATQTLTKTVETTKKHYVTAIHCVIVDSEAVTNRINCVLKEDTTAKWSDAIARYSAQGTAIGFAFTHPIEISENKAANFVIDAGGGTVITIANMSGYTV